MAGHMGDLICDEGSVQKTSTWLRTTRIWPSGWPPTLVSLQDGGAQVFGRGGIRKVPGIRFGFCEDFLLQDELIPARDVTL